MTKQMNHIEALQYLCEKPEVNKVKTNAGSVLRISFAGDVVDDRGLTSFGSYCGPFTAVEPEKTNRQYAKELHLLTEWEETELRRLEIMDEKIKKAIK
jgi:hypothetical protein